jgi:transcriptional regulator GlxA family with amidase domain
MDRRIQRLQQLLDGEQFGRLTIADLAATVNLSVSRTEHLFKQQTGMPLGQYIKAVRMDRAKVLLDSSALSVKEIVWKLGRTDQSHFGRNFKNAFGKSPAQYRSRVPVAGSHPRQPRNKMSHR